MARRLLFLWLALAAAGCQSISTGPYVAPQVTGRVLAADSHAPLAGVTVVRSPVEPPPPAGAQPKGGELLMRKAPIKTGPDGRFTLPSERVLSFVRWGTWDSIPLALEREGYHRCQTNFPAATLLATNTPDGAPWLDTGDILLVPRRP